MTVFEVMGRRSRKKNITYMSSQQLDASEIASDAC